MSQQLSQPCGSGRELGRVFFERRAIVTKVAVAMVSLHPLIMSHKRTDHPVQSMGAMVNA